jgi:hypothetical protein
MGQIRCIAVDLQLESMESIGIKKESNERYNITEEEKRISISYVIKRTLLNSMVK